MIEVNQRVEVPASPQDVWAVLSDPHAVVECVKGASLGERHEDGSYDAGLLVSFGPAKVTFRAQFNLELDPPAMTGKVTSRGKDKQGGTKIKADMTFAVTERADPPGSVIIIDAKTEVSGRMAMIVEGGAKMVVEHMTKDFSRRLTARLAGTPITD